MRSSPKPNQPDAEAGFVLLMAIFLCVLLLISLAVAAPKMARSIQRDKELETIHRGEQYRRAIQLYYRKFSNYPTSIDQLVETNQMRFLRKKYKDPMTGKDDWKPILFGQAHVRPLGFFGQPLMAMAGLAGSTASMYALAPATTDANGVPVAGDDSSSATGAASPASGTSTGGGMFGSSPSTPSTGFGTPAGSSPGAGSMFGNSSPMGSNSTSPMGSGTPGSSAGIGGGASGTSATTFGGGGPIVGFTLPVKKPSLIDYMKQTSYNHWEFNYDPMADQAQAMSGLGGGAGAANSNGTNGTQNGSSPFGTTTQPPNNGSTLMSPDSPTTDSPGTTTQPQTEPQ
jgi:type II secretory pathway pseudopilin PulG